jgi:multicomponent Na+:H+ antiporter subunit G
MFQAGWSAALLKLLLILAFLLLTSPTATHAIAKAALHSKLKPMPEPPGVPSSKS